MKKSRKKRRDALYSALMAGGPLDGLSVLTAGQPLLLVEDIVEQERTVCFVKHAYQMNLAAPKEDVLFYEYVGWLNSDEQDLRSLNPELN
jgi:hypothetical protein